MKRAKIFALVMMALSTSAAMAQSSVWKWSNELQTYSYRDNDGRVHYGDGSVSQPDPVWFENGKAVYPANSAGPADKTGQYAIQAPRIDESKVGSAPSGPPTNAVLVMPGSSTGPVAGPQPTKPVYIVPSGQTAINPPSSSGSSAGVSNNGQAGMGGGYEFSVAATPGGYKPANNNARTGATYTGTDSSVWQWSNSGQYYYYRDNDGRVHYSDGSVSDTNTVWSDNTGRAVYSANSSGPKDKTGQYAIQAPRIDESNIGPAPKTPPSDAVLTMPDPSKPSFGPGPTGPIYVAPDSQAKPNQPTYAGKGIGNNTPDANQVVSAPGLAAGVDTTTLMKAIEKAQSQGGDFSSIVSNPFVFCSGAKPKKGNPLRIVWEMICGSSQDNGKATAEGNSSLNPTNPASGVGAGTAPIPTPLPKPVPVIRSNGTGGLAGS